MMPKMDGIETLKRLREEHLLKEGCVVIALIRRIDVTS